MAPPFCDARRAEVVARVAFQLVRLMVNRNSLHDERPGAVLALAQTLPFVRERLDFRLALSSMHYYCVTNQRKSRFWLNTVLERSRQGEQFRAAFFWDYKAGRADPRVTNRGVGLAQALLTGDESYDSGFEAQRDDS